MKAKKPRTKWVDFKQLKEKIGMIDALSTDLLDTFVHLDVRK